MEDTDYPSTFRLADSLAKNGQRRYMREVLVQLAMAVVIAFGAEMSGFLPHELQVVVAILIALLLLVVLVEQFRRRTLTKERQWFHARALAESVKTLAWRYMMRAAPFRDDPTADGELRAILDRLLQSDRQLLGTQQQDHLEPITARMRAVRDLGWDERRAAYVAFRLDDQVEWYGTKASDNARRSEQFSRASAAALVLALVGAILRISLPELHLVGTFTTLAASLVAWSQTRHFDEVATSYAIARNELQQIRERAALATTEAGGEHVVLDAESAISREHTMWYAKSSTAIRPHGA